ncbi:MAG TPA: protein kinase [Thermoanaerobaculia bacterium]|nr:protein kinase [Thermoanaerobaculia bacterium]
MPGRMLGRYRLEELLGRGGMAEVWRAEDTKLGRAVAVKVIHADHATDRNFVERFLREARVVASLEHPNILPVYDFGEEEGLPFLVMPFLEGGTLRDRMQSGPVPIAKAALWIGQLAGALDAAHEAGVLHRDVKPANVLLGKGDRLFLADFGIAKMLETVTGLTATGMVVGTPLYMAPEQAQGKPATPATDRYALAVISFELLAGRPPFEGENPLSLMHQHVTTPAPALSAKISGLPAGLDAVFVRALAKDPAERHPTSSAFAAAVIAFAPTGIAGAVPSTAAQAAPTVLQSDRARPVATPAPGLTSDETILTGTGRARKNLLRGLAAAVVVVAAGSGVFLLRGREKAETSPTGPAGTATPPAVATSGSGVPSPALSVAASPSDPLSKNSPAVFPTPDAEAKKLAELEARLRKAEKELAMSPRAAAVPAPTPAPPLPAHEVSAPAPDESPAKSPAARLLKPALDRLDPSRRGARRLTREDFEVGRAAARSALKEEPEMAEARTLEIYAGGGLAYVVRDDVAASQALVEAFAHAKRTGRREIRPLAFLLRGPGGTIVPPKGWELALAYGDARGEAESLLAAALARNPNDPKALLGRAQLRRLEGRTAEFLADLRRAAEANPAPQFRQRILEVLKSACRSGLAEACREAESLGGQTPALRRRNP